MRRHRRALLRPSLVLAAVLATSGPAWGFPDLDPAREEALVEPGLVPGPAHTLGRWLADENGVALQAPSEIRGLTYWLPEADGAVLADGLVRARFTFGSNPDATVLFRARLGGAAPDEMSAYGVSLEPDAAALYRWERGVVLPMGPRVSIPGLSGRQRVEVVVFAVGPWIAAQVYDADTLTELASLTAHDTALVEGRVGVRAFIKQDAGTRLTHLSVARAAPVPPAPEGSTGRRGDPHAPLGEERLVLIDAGDLGQLPEGLGKAIVRRGTVDGRDLAWVVTDPVGAERIRRSGVDPLSVSGDVPFWAVDRRYRARMDRPPTPTETGFRIDESYKDHRMVEALLEGYAARYPEICRVVELGRTHQGRAILALRITDAPGSDEGEPAVLLIGAHHGGELLAIEYALDSVQRLLEGYEEDPGVRRWVDSLDIWCVPLVNPDGNWTFLRQSQWTQRKNGRDLDGDGRLDAWDGVDLNRNYPFRWGQLGERGSRSLPRSRYYRGPEPGSEPEVQAVIALADRYRFVAAISWHTAATVVLSPYTIDGVANPKPDVARAVCEPIVAGMPKQPNGRRMKVKRKIYSVDGTDQDWHYHRHGTLAFLVEGSHHNPLNLSLARRSVEAVRPFTTGLLDRVVEGPALTARITDPGGEPLEAEVIVDGVLLSEGESWRSRPHDGRADRLLPAAGSYTVRARAGGYEDGVATVTVGQEWVQLDLALHPMR